MKIIKISLSILLTACNLLFAISALAYDLDVDLPGAPKDIKHPGEYMRYLFLFGLAIVGVVAVAAMVVGGFIWMTSGGNQAMVGKAKDFIWGAIAGLLLLLCSYIILHTINPDLVNWRLELPSSSPSGPPAPPPPSPAERIICNAFILKDAEGNPLTGFRYEWAPKIETNTCTSLYQKAGSLATCQGKAPDCPSPGEPELYRNQICCIRDFTQE